MESLLRVDTSSTFPGSPTNSFLADEVASTCPLLTPSPPTNALVNSSTEQDDEHSFISADELVSKLHHVHDEKKEGDDSASHSSSSSAMAEPACTQLLSGHNPYLHITKDEDAAAQETNGKTQTLQMTFRNPPENYFFMKWNWPLIRKISAWLFLSVLVAMVAVVVAMIWTLPKTCNPATQWYQGKLMYEIFPASFADSNGDGIGDLRGIASRIDYLDSLGVKSVRLNSIFIAPNYPENYKNTSSLTEIAPQLGNMTDFTILLNSLHLQNMSLCLDLPVWPYVRTLPFPSSAIKKEIDFNTSDGQPFYEFLRSQYEDPISSALKFWSSVGVDGFYLKSLELLKEDPYFIDNLKNWKRIIGPDRMLMVKHNVIANATDVLDYIDLVDIRLEIEGGVEKVSQQIESVLNSTLFTKSNSPWIHWSLSNESTVRLANRPSPFNNATLGASLLQLMLPGTPGIFYGDEIGLQQVSDPHQDRKGIQHLHQLAVMSWEGQYKPFTRQGILPWMHSQPTQVNFAQLEVISKMVALRSTSPSIYAKAVCKDGTSKANAEVKYKENDLLVIQRWYPRRKSYVVVSNLGFVHIAADLSTLLYAGEIVVGPSTHLASESISFKDISLWPGESVVILLQ